jgi:hypothetical protein
VIPWEFDRAQGYCVSSFISRNLYLPYSDKGFLIVPIAAAPQTTEADAAVAEAA